MTAMTTKAMTMTARTKGNENDDVNDEELANVENRMRQLLLRRTGENPEEAAAALGEDEEAVTN